MGQLGETYRVLTPLREALALPDFLDKIRETREFADTIGKLSMTGDAMRLHRGSRL